MTKKERLRREILTSLSRVYIANTIQLESFFQEHGSPKKRASEFLRSLQEEKVIEGRQLSIGKAKNWRLTKQGWLTLGMDRNAIPFQSNKVDHLLSIGNVFFHLHHKGGLKSFRTELREPFYSTHTSSIKKYCPDAFFHYRNELYLLEVQLTPLSTRKWRKKWELAEEFFYEGHYQKVTWHPFEKEYIPTIVVISSQSEHVVKAGTELPVSIIRNATDF